MNNRLDRYPAAGRDDRASSLRVLDLFRTECLSLIEGGLRGSYGDFRSRVLRREVGLDEVLDRVCEWRRLQRQAS